MIQRTRAYHERITTGDLCIVPMTEAHALAMKNWGRHPSSLYREYNYCDMTQDALRVWFKERNNRTNRYYSILQNGSMTGFIGLKEIAPLRRRSVLGFSVDKNKEGEGIGGSALRAFLPVYFTQMGFAVMDLYVYAYNERAIRLYKKLGFHLVDTTMDLFRNPANFPAKNEEEQYEDAFYRIEEGVYAKVYQMRLHARDVGRWL